MIELHFLPYGRVDAILIGVDGHWAFVDGGYRKDGKKAVQYMREMGITQLKSYIATHRHRNHVGAAPYIIANMSVERVYTVHPDMEYRLYDLAVGTEEKFWTNAAIYTVTQPGNSCRVGDAVFTCIGPDKLKKCSAGAYGENSNSLIFRIEYKGRSVLLTGDTTAGILGKCPNDKLRCEVLKNPHHNGALGEKLLKRIQPDITVVCNGKAPAKYYQRRLADIGSDTYTAGKKGNGLVVLIGDENGWQVKKGV